MIDLLQKISAALVSPNPHAGQMTQRHGSRFELIAVATDFLYSRCFHTTPNR